MSPLAQLRAEIGDTLLRSETIAKHIGFKHGPYAADAANTACTWLQRLHAIVGAELAKELEAAKAKESTSV